MIIDKIALALAIIGALNWGGIGLFGFDTVAFLCGGQMAVLSRVIYALVGLAGLWCVTMLFRSSGEEDTGRAPHAA
ncbi:MAG: DUF378 domain-containing protein [Oscillibacter sp.]|nr:DUF378 domain-containing protein [Oscillibacter sp.]